MLRGPMVRKFGFSKSRWQSVHFTNDMSTKEHANKSPKHHMKLAHENDEFMNTPPFNALCLKHGRLMSMITIYRSLMAKLPRPCHLQAPISAYFWACELSYHFGRTRIHKICTCLNCKPTLRQRSWLTHTLTLRLTYPSVYIRFGPMPMTVFVEPT